MRNKKGIFVFIAFIAIIAFLFIAQHAKAQSSREQDKGRLGATLGCGNPQDAKAKIVIYPAYYGREVEKPSFSGFFSPGKSEKFWTLVPEVRTLEFKLDKKLLNGTEVLKYKDDRLLTLEEARKFGLNEKEGIVLQGGWSNLRNLPKLDVKFTNLFDYRNIPTVNIEFNGQLYKLPSRVPESAVIYQDRDWKNKQKELQQIDHKKLVEF